MKPQEIYNQLEAIALGCKNGKIVQNELEKYLTLADSKTKTEVMVKLDKNGLLHRSSDTPPLLIEFKRHWDSEGLKQLQDNGSYTFTPSDAKSLESIVNDPNPSSSRLFVETCYKNLDGGLDLFHPTINNSNESSRRIRTEQNGKLKASK